MISVDSRRSAKELSLVRMPVKYCIIEKVLIHLMKLTPLIEHKHPCCLKVVLAVPGYLFLMGESDLPGRFYRILIYAWHTMYYVCVSPITKDIPLGTS